MRDVSVRLLARKYIYLLPPHRSPEHLASGPRRLPAGLYSGGRMMRSSPHDAVGPRGLPLTRAGPAAGPRTPYRLYLLSRVFHVNVWLQGHGDCVELERGRGTGGASVCGYTGTPCANSQANSGERPWARGSRRRCSRLIKWRNPAFLGLLSIALWWTVFIVVRFASSPAADGSSGGGGGGGCGGGGTGGSDGGRGEMARGARGGTGGNDLLPAPLAPLTPDASPLSVPSPSRAPAPSHPAPLPPDTTPLPLPVPAPSRPPHDRSGAADAAAAAGAGAGAGVGGGGPAAAVEGGEGGEGGDREMEKVRESRAGGEGGEGGAAAAPMGVGPRPLVAVYFTGQARTLNRTVCSVRRRVLGPLLAQGFAPVIFVVGVRPAMYCPPLQSPRCRPSLCEHKAPHDVASIICPARRRGGGRGRAWQILLATSS